MSKKILPVFLVSLLLISAMGCKKWRNNRETLTSEDHTLAEASFNDVIKNILIATSPVGQLLVDSCFTIQQSGGTFPQTVTIDFGNTECEGLFGTTMQGRIIVVLGDSMHHPGAVAAISTENLYCNQYSVEGDITVENTGTNSSGYPEYDVTVVDGIITAEEDRTGEDFTVSWTCTYHYAVMERNNQLVVIDDLHHITGNATGINREGRDFTATIIEPLKKYLNCRWPGGGKTTITPTDLKERDLSYGECEPNSTCCDNIAKELVKWPDQTVLMR